MPKIRFPVVVTSSDQAQLKQWESAHGTPQQVALRCRIILSAIAGEQLAQFSGEVVWRTDAESNSSREFRQCA